MLACLWVYIVLIPTAFATALSPNISFTDCFIDHGHRVGYLHADGKLLLTLGATLKPCIRNRSQISLLEKLAWKP